MMASTVNRMMQAYGANYTLWRQAQSAGAHAWDSGAMTDTFYACRGRDRHFQFKIVQGALQEDVTILVVDAASLSVVPRKGDRIARGSYVASAGADWFQITNVNAPRLGDSVAVYRLDVSK